MFPKARLDALNDGIFSVAMTLLALDIRLPEEFNPADGSELLQAFAKLWPKLLPYVLSFALALGLVSPRIALRALALNFAQPVIER